MSASTRRRATAWRRGLSAIAAAALALVAAPALASSVDSAVVDATVPTGSVSLDPGASGPITIKLTVTGNQDGTATFQVNRDWTLSNGTFTGSNPQTFTVSPRAAQDPATTFSTTGTVSVGAGQASGTFTLKVGTFNITNSNSTGAKLGAGAVGTYSVTVAVSNTAPHVSVGGVTDGATYEIGSVPAASCTVTDAEDSNPSATPTLSAVSGSLSSYGLGTQKATCSYTDAGGLKDSATATYTIVDTTKPTLNTPGDQVLEATGPSGAEASWSVTASDNVQAGPVTCDVTSPHTFALGEHTVNCSVTDVAGNTRDGSFKITVQDTTDPSVIAPSDVTAEATGPGGATVAYGDPSASDLHDGTLEATCAPASRTLFGLGNTPVTCSATDSSGNTGSAGFSVHVVDTTPPTVTVPSDKTVEATGPSGASVTFSASANDLVDGAIVPTCSADSGSTFALGTTVVTCSATDAHGNLGTNSFSVKVEDTKPPVLTVPADMSVEATGPSGATVPFSASASDVVDGNTAVTCDPASDALFPLGDTTVNCSSTDAHGNTGKASFKVSVVDTTAPALTVPSDKTAEATGPAGAAVSFSATATDLVDGATAVTCDPASGSTFALGDTTVKCSSTDAHGNTGKATFKVTVVDTTAPTLHLPANITRSATSAAGAVATFTASADDLVDGSVPVTCVQASGSTFAPGVSTVTCSATDAAGNTAQGTFTVTVNFGWNGFFAPVDNNGVLNTIKGGQSVPMKWNIPNGSGGWISSLDVVKSVKQGEISCSATAPSDDVEATTTGGTSLRYDTTANQYIYNWQSPKTTGKCYSVNVTLTDGTSHVALFKTK